MTFWNIFALVLGIISGVLCMAAVVLGIMVFIAVMKDAKEDYRNWEDDK